MLRVNQEDKLFKVNEPGEKGENPKYNLIYLNLEKGIARRI